MKKYILIHGRRILNFIKIFKILSELLQKSPCIKMVGNITFDVDYKIIR